MTLKNSYVEDLVLASLWWFCCCLFVWVGGVGRKGATGVRVTAIAWTVDSSPPDPGQNSFL